MFDLKAISTDNLIDIIGIILTLLAIIISIWQFTKSIKNSIIEAKKQMALEQTSELPFQVAKFCECASAVAVGIFIGVNNLEKGLREQYENSKKTQDEILPEIKGRIFAYGSIEAIKIFIKFESIISNINENGTSVNAYYLLPLLMSQVKMDVTGEIINPILFFNSLMPSFKEHNKKAKEYINNTIDDLRLENKLKVF